jgi:acetoin utilization deacetylase AcuC-like enzyme
MTHLKTALRERTYHDAGSEDLMGGTSDTNTPSIIVLNGHGNVPIINLPLTHDSGDEAFVAANDAGLARLNAFGADVLLVALGLDTYRGDPLGVLSVTTDGSRRGGEVVGGILQQGGYACRELGENLVAFAKAVDD